MPGRKLQIWVALLAMPALLGCVYPLQRRIDAQAQTVQQEKEQLLLRSPKLIKKLGMGYDGLVADIYWTRAVQYYGGKVRDHDPNFELLMPLLDITTTLDPQLLVAYKFGAIFLAEPRPRGAQRPDLAVQLVRKGIANNPAEWRLWHDLGFIYYSNLRDYKSASEAYLAGSRVPGAREWMKVMAARIATEGGSNDISRFLWSEIYNSSRDANIRKNALEHLNALRAEQDIEELQKLAGQFLARVGRPPQSLRELVAAGLLPAVPLDPTGTPYVIDSYGHAGLGPSSKINIDILKPKF